MYISKLEIYIFRLEMKNFRRLKKNFRGFGGFSPRCFRFFCALSGAEAEVGRVFPGRIPRAICLFNMANV